MEGPPKKKFRGDIEKDREINDLPVEVLTRIFKICVESNSASSLISSFYHVCTLWRDIVENPCLWNDIPSDENMNISMFLFLIKKDLLLHATTLSFNNIYERDHSKLIQVFQNCPSLKSVRFEKGTVHGSAVISLLKDCPELESLTFTQTHKCFTPGYYSDYFLINGPQLRCINLHDLYIKDGFCFFHTIAQFCPNLEELRVAKLKGDMMVFPIGPFQISCCKLLILVLHDVNIAITKTDTNQGFKELVSFSCNKGIKTGKLPRLLGGSTLLRFLSIGYFEDADLQSICELPFVDLQIFCVPAQFFSDTRILKAKWPNLEFPCIANKATELPTHILKNLHPDWIDYV